MTFLGYSNDTPERYVVFEVINLWEEAQTKRKMRLNEKVVAPDANEKAIARPSDLRQPVIK